MPRGGWVLKSGVRALALFALVNLGFGLFSRTWDANHLWVQGAGAVPTPILTALILLFAVGVLVLPGRKPAVDLATRYLAGMLAIACLADAISFYRLLAIGQVRSSLPLPLSLGLAVLLLLWALRRRDVGTAGEPSTRRALWIRVMDHSTPLLLAAVGVLAHLLTFGATDYRRPADAAVVFGAAVRAGGVASPALRDRTMTACGLYHQGLVQHLVLSGGRDPRMPCSEVDCMEKIALSAGVPASALIRDDAGVDSRSSIRAARNLADTHGWSRVLLVSHDYHLARLQLLGERAGLDAATVPARESVAWPTKPLFIGREVLAWAYWYLRPSSL
jgi:vancomycin permeability regulator SanA